MSTSPVVDLGVERALPLAELAAALPAEQRGDALVRDATHDSRQVGPGVLFCAVPGATSDGHDFAPGAVADGAAALLVERWLDLDVPQLRVASVRRAMGPAAAAIHRAPSRRLTTVGVTGTNGKTTTCYLLEAVFGAAGVGTGLIGTVETRIHGQAQPGIRTTPEGTDLQRLLATMYDRGADAVAMEVSSHGLDLHRVDGTHYDVAVFTNLSQDHLDFHGDMESYFDAKSRLFTRGFADRAVVNVDDEWGRRLAATTELPVTTYGRDPDADHVLVAVQARRDGTTIRVRGPDGERELSTRLLGAVNAQNVLAAYLAGVAAGVDPEAAADGVSACSGVPGRLERVDGGREVAVLVDYAHTPDAVARLVDVARTLVAGAGRVHLVVGAGGDRDRGKRPLMGAAAAAADHAVITSDNPRSEDPHEILDAVATGAREAIAAGAPARLTIEVDRRVAIAAALEAAAPGDVVLIAGKGHETGQELAGHTIPFDDREVARELLAASDR